MTKLQRITYDIQHPCPLLEAVIASNIKCRRIPRMLAYIKVTLSVLLRPAVWVFPSTPSGFLSLVLLALKLQLLVPHNSFHARTRSYF